MTLDEAHTALEFSDEWLRLGVVTPEQVDQFAVELISGDDPNPEHFRWRAFCDFLRDITP